MQTSVLEPFLLYIGGVTAMSRGAPNVDTKERGLSWSTAPEEHFHERKGGIQRWIRVYIVCILFSALLVSRCARKSKENLCWLKRSSGLV